MSNETLASEDTVLIKKEEYDKLCRQSFEYVKLSNRIQVQDFVIKVLTRKLETVEAELNKLQKRI